MMADVPFADLHRTLERMRTDYKIEPSGQAPLPTGGATLRYVRARRNSHEVKGPQTIEIWADPTTAVPKRIVFDDAKIQGNRQPCRLTFDLASQEPLAADWFKSRASRFHRRRPHWHCADHAIASFMPARRFVAWCPNAAVRLDITDGGMAGLGSAREGVAFPI